MAVGGDRAGSRPAPTVSIVMAARNASSTIGETVRSAIGQTFHDFELIIVDDGSSDGTESVARSFSDERVEVLRLPHVGVSAARNIGARESTGRFLAFLDADDLWESGKLACEVQALERDETAGLAYGWTDLIDERGRPLFRGGRSVLAGNIYEHLLKYNVIEAGNPLIRRVAFERADGFDESLTRAEDWDLWARIAREWPVVCVPRTHVYYRIVAGSMSGDVVRQGAECLRVVDKMYGQAPNSCQAGRSVTLCYLYRYLALRAMFCRPTPVGLVRMATLAVRSYRARPRLVPFVILSVILSVGTVLSVVRARPILYWLSCRIPRGSQGARTAP